MTSSVLHHDDRRRGAILLISLTALTFFMMIGTLLLITATRSRTTARAFADVASSSATTTAQADAILDEALLVVLRGRRDQTALPQTMQHHSLLQDKYGPNVITGTATAGLVRNLTEAGPIQGKPAILEAELTSLKDSSGAGITPHPCDFNGRVLTFRPQADDGDVASYRILRAVEKSGRYTVYLANLPTARSPILPRKDCEVLVNGREFMPESQNDQNEPWDAFDAENPWLAQVELEASKVKQVPRPSFSGTGGGPAVVDNDNDGVADGIWISGALAAGHSPNGICPDRPSPLGGVLQYDFSFHIVDLDGRVNVNAHGSPTSLSQNSADWPATFITTQIANVPVGLGFGPADVGASRLFFSGSQTSGLPGFPGRWQNLCESGTATQQTGISATQRRPTPQIGTGVDGRYGPVDTTSGSNRWVPGKPGATVDPLLQCSIGGTATVSGSSRTIGASPTDLNARMKVFLQDAATGSPTLTFYTPARGANDMLESPYQLRLDVDASRPQQLRQSGTAKPVDNVFTPAEFERVLRQFDADASTLPPRLAALLDDFAQRSRMTITTDSWDTPVISGTAMLRLRDAMRSFPNPTSPAPSAGTPNSARVYDLFSPDVVAGMRFDLNRPLAHPVVAASLEPAIEERYCRHLYTLLWSLGLPASRETAQWVANVVDFRDADSTMTRFRYDTNPADGWDVNNDTYVFGAERPEMVVTETVAWPGKLAVVLYHPWDARVVDKDTPSDAANKYTPVEMVDPNLAASNAPNSLDLTRKVGNDSVWQLRVVGQAGSTVAFASQNAGGAANKCVLKPNEYLCVQTDSGMGGGVSSIQVSTFTPGSPGIGKVVLERLADPTKSYNANTSNAAFNPYVAVDEAALVIAADQQSATRQIRDDTKFWTGRQWSPGAAGDTAPATYTKKIPWFHWPNRPFISAAELALVPTGDASLMLASGTVPSPARKSASLILDAVHVPSRFVGGAQRIGTDATLRDAATNEEVCTTMLPRWREPGRINVNTVVANPNNTPSQLDNGVWQALLGPGAGSVGGGTNPFVSGQPARSMGDMLTLQSGTAVFYEPPDPALPARDNDEFFRYARAIRLSNAATVRSHVFAVWITLRITDTSPAASAPVYRRMFAIVDRSIPVGFTRGETLNARDTIRLQRFLD
jgi:hypothetical protein